MVGCREVGAVLDPAQGPAVLPAPESGRMFEIRAWRMPGSDVDGQTWFIHDAGVLALEPLVVPADGLVTPLHAGIRVGLVWECMRPGTNHCLDRRVHVFEHSRQAVAVAVIPAADVEARNLYAVILVARRGPIPERSVALLILIGQHPRLCIEAVFEIGFVDHVIRSPGPCVVEILAHFPGIEMHDAVHVVHVVLVEVLGGVDGNDRLEGRGIAERHLDRVEAAP